MVADTITPTEPAMEETKEEKQEGFPYFMSLVFIVVALCALLTFLKGLVSFILIPVSAIGLPTEFISQRYLLKRYPDNKPVLLYIARLVQLFSVLFVYLLIQPVSDDSYHAYVFGLMIVTRPSPLEALSNNLFTVSFYIMLITTFGLMLYMQYENSRKRHSK